MISIDELTNMPSEVDVRKEVDGHLLGDLLIYTLRKKNDNGLGLTILHHLHGYTYEELAKAIGRSKDTVAKHIWRCERFVKWKFPEDEVPFVRYEYHKQLEEDKRLHEEWIKKWEIQKEKDRIAHEKLQEKLRLEEIEREKWHKARQKEIAANTKAWLYFENLRATKQQVSISEALLYCDKDPIPQNVELSHHSSRWQLDAGTLAWWEANNITQEQYVNWLTKALINQGILKIIDPYAKQ